MTIIKQKFMNQTGPLKVIPLILTALIITACASSGPIGEWRKEGFSGALDDILVIGVTSRSTRRRVFEDKFVEELAAFGVKATPSYELIESSMYLSREIVEKAIEGRNLGGVVVTRLAAIKEAEVYQPPVNQNEDEDLTYFTFYDKAFHQQEKGTTATYGVLTLETNLYDTQSGGYSSGQCSPRPSTLRNPAKSWRNTSPKRLKPSPNEA